MLEDEKVTGVGLFGLRLKFLNIRNENGFERDIIWAWFSKNEIERMKQKIQMSTYFNHFFNFAFNPDIEKGYCILTSY